MANFRQGDWYDHPRHYECLFESETEREADFLEAAFRQYGTPPVRNLLEPGCGSGRLVIEMARRGYAVTGLDRNVRSLAFLRQRLRKRGLRATLKLQDATAFTLRRRSDAAFCTFNTFRHFLSEEAAQSHLESVALALRPGGLYVLGLHLLPLDVAEECVERWSGRVGQTRVTATLRVLAMDRRLRRERLRLSLHVRSPQRVWRLRSEFDLRLYTAGQLRRLLAKIPTFELLDVFDFWYEIDRPLALNDEITDTVLVLRRR